MDHKSFDHEKNRLYIITAGSTYLDIDAYACAVAMAELLCLQGKEAVAYSTAPCNYSVCESLVEEGQILRTLPPDRSEESAGYIVVDVSDPEFLKSSVPLERVIEVYDHHVGFETYWRDRIGGGAHIEFIGAAVTLILRAWQEAGLSDKMSRSTARLLVAAILDNTLNLTSSNTTEEDVEAFGRLCERGGVDPQTFRASYFSEVQGRVEADLKHALLRDMKAVRETDRLPPSVAQLCVWDADRLWERMPDMRRWLNGAGRAWMINVIGLKQGCSYFLCDSEAHQRQLERVFDVRFRCGVAKTKAPYLRKQIIKRCVEADAQQ